MSSQESFLPALYFQKIDPQGRIILPIEIRKKLENDSDQPGQYVLCLGFNFQNLQLLSITNWQELMNNIDNGVGRFSALSYQDRQELLIWKSAAKEVNCDRQGRLNLTEELRQYAGFEAPGEVIITGGQRAIHLWSRDAWDDFTKKVR